MEPESHCDEAVLPRAVRLSSDYDATVADIREGLVDYELGRGEPLSDAFADIRRQVAESRVVH